MYKCFEAKFKEKLFNTHVLIQEHYTLYVSYEIEILSLVYGV